MLALDKLNIRSLSLKAENDKSSSLSLSVYRSPQMKEGKIQLAVFSAEKKGGPIFKCDFDRAWTAATRRHWENLLTADKEGDKVTAKVTTRERTPDGQNKSIVVGNITYGLDKSGAPYIGITVGETALKFLLRGSYNYMHTEELKRSDANRIAVEGNFLAYLRDLESAVAMSMLVPGEPQQGGGGFKKGGGGGSYNNNRSGGGGGGRRNDDLDDEIGF